MRATTAWGTHVDARTLTHWLLVIARTTRAQHLCTAAYNSCSIAQSICTYKCRGQGAWAAAAVGAPDMRPHADAGYAGGAGMDHCVHLTQ